MEVGSREVTAWLWRFEEVWCVLEKASCALVLGSRGRVDQQVVYLEWTESDGGGGCSLHREVSLDLPLVGSDGELGQL